VAALDAYEGDTRMYCESRDCAIPRDHLWAALQTRSQNPEAVQGLDPEPGPEHQTHEDHDRPVVFLQPAQQAVQQGARPLREERGQPER